MSGDKRRIGIITPYGWYNYGNRLQNLAVTQLICSAGADTVTLALRNTGLIGAGRFLKSRGIELARAPRAQVARWRAFRHFDAALSRRYVLRGKGCAARQLDSLVIGSDQIWNPWHIAYRGAEYGSFMPGERVMSLSASFGVSVLAPNVQEFARPLLNQIAHISVREHAGADIVKELTGRDVPVLIDPTLAVDESIWAARASARLLPDRPYVLSFVLGAGGQERVPDVAESLGLRSLQIVPLNDQRSPKYFSAGPAEFLGLIAGAELIVTDSYHATIFALLNKRRCVIFDRQGNEPGMTARFETLARLLSLTYRPIDNLPRYREVISHRSEFEAALALRRREFFEFFDTALESVLSCGPGAR